MSRQWKIAKVSSIQQITSTVKSFHLENVDKTQFEFEAGQFITLDLPISERKSKRIRSYSIASSPQNKTMIELIVVLSTTSEGGSQYLFDDVSVGSQLTYRGPLGSFTLPSAIHHDIIFVCTGTGIAPFISMVEYILHNKIAPHNQFTIIFGCRTKQDLIYADRLYKLANTFANFQYIPTLSKQQWEGATGYVHQVYMNMKNTIKADTHFYLCGWRNMVDEARSNIQQMGIPSDAIHYELYG